ncbi:unnamed protein product [Pedinophyceae sp. YPF-701]|nr:unnamed protein product [Pedinophyceae sp. YPF-701]
MFGPKGLLLAGGLLAGRFIVGKIRGGNAEDESEGTQTPDRNSSAGASEPHAAAHAERLEAERAAAAEALAAERAAREAAERRARDAERIAEQRLKAEAERRARERSEAEAREVAARAEAERRAREEREAAAAAAAKAEKALREQAELAEAERRAAEERRAQEEARRAAEAQAAQAARTAQAAAAAVLGDPDPGASDHSAASGALPDAELLDRLRAGASLRANELQVLAGSQRSPTASSGGEASATERDEAERPPLIAEGQGKVEKRLLEAAEMGSVRRIVVAVKVHHADVNTQGRDGLGGLHLAAREGHVDAVACLLSLGANADVADEQGRTPLMWAAEEGHDAVVKLLAGAGASLTATDNNNRSVAHVCAQNGNLGVLRTLVEERGLSVASIPAPPVAEYIVTTACRAGAADVTAYLVQQQRMSPNVQEGDGTGPLAAAAVHSSEGCVRALLEAGADVNIADKLGATPASLAARHGNVNILRILIDRGAKLNTQDAVRGWTPLHNAVAARHSDVTILSVLVERCPALLQAQDSEGLTPRALADMLTHFDASHFLRDKERAKGIGQDDPADSKRAMLAGSMASQPVKSMSFNLRSQQRAGISSTALRNRQLGLEGEDAGPESPSQVRTFVEDAAKAGDGAAKVPLMGRLQSLKGSDFAARAAAAPQDGERRTSTDSVGSQGHVMALGRKKALAALSFRRTSGAGGSRPLPGRAATVATGGVTWRTGLDHQPLVAFGGRAVIPDVNPVERMLRKYSTSHRLIKSNQLKSALKGVKHDADKEEEARKAALSQRRAQDSAHTAHSKGSLTAVPEDAQAALAPLSEGEEDWEDSDMEHSKHARDVGVDKDGTALTSPGEEDALGRDAHPDAETRTGPVPRRRAKSPPARPSDGAPDSDEEDGMVPTLGKQAAAAAAGGDEESDDEEVPLFMSPLARRVSMQATSMQAALAKK